MSNSITYILNIQPNAQLSLNLIEQKETIKSWLTVNDYPTFLEASLEGDFWPNEAEVNDALHQLATNNSPLQVYEYSHEKLHALKNKIELNFNNNYICNITQISTESWQEDWKNNFQPIYTDQFCVLPPWIKKGDIPIEHQSLQSIVIEPACAFGTGQHETTLLCLKEIEKYFASNTSMQSVFDIGTGTGILAIACTKYNCEKIIATDIDANSIAATQINIDLNTDLIKGFTIRLEQGSIPTTKDQANLIIANILKQPLIDLMHEFSNRLKPNGELILSGFLQKDVEDLKISAQKSGLSYVRHSLKNDWACLVVKK